MIDCCCGYDVDVGVDGVDGVAAAVVVAVSAVENYEYPLHPK